MMNQAGTTGQETFGMAGKAMELFNRCETTGLLTAAEEFGDFMDQHCVNTVKSGCWDAQKQQTEHHVMEDGTVWAAHFEGNFETDEVKTSVWQSLDHEQNLKLQAANS